MVRKQLYKYKGNFVLFNPKNHCCDTSNVISHVLDKIIAVKEFYVEPPLHKKKHL